jgi:hypothetical protein
MKMTETFPAQKGAVLAKSGIIDLEGKLFKRSYLDLWMEHYRRQLNFRLKSKLSPMMRSKAIVCVAPAGPAG